VLEILLINWLDNLYAFLDNYLWSEKDWNIRKNRPNYMDAMEKMSPKFKPFVSGLVSPNKSIRGIQTLLPYDEVYPEFHGMPLHRALYQFFGSTTSIDVGRGRNIDWKGLKVDKTGRSFMPGLFEDEMLDGGLRNYMHRANVLITHSKETHEQQVWMDKKFLNRFGVVRHGGHAIVDTKIEKLAPGQFIKPNDSFGVLNGIAQHYKGNTEAVITSVKSYQGKTRIEFDYLHKAKAGMKVLVKGLTKGIIRETADMTDGVDMMVGHDTLKTVDPAGMLTIMLGRISAWAGKDANKKAAVVRAVKSTGISDKLNVVTHRQTGELVIKANAFKESIFAGNYDKALNSIVKVMKSLKMTQDVPSFSNITASAAGVTAVMNRTWDAAEKGAVVSELIRRISIPGSMYSQFYQKAWEMSPDEFSGWAEEARKMVGEIKSYDSAVVDKIFSKKYVSFLEIVRPLVNKQQPGDFTPGVLVSNMQFGFSQLESLMGRGGGTVPLNISFLNVLKHQPGSSKLFEGLLNMAQEQNSYKMGQLRRQFAISQGVVEPGGVDIIQKFNSILKGVEGNEFKKMAKKFLHSDPSEWGSMAKIADQTFHEIEGTLYDVNSPEYSKLPTYLKAKGKLISEQIIRGRTVPRDIADLFQKIGLGYVKTPKATFAKVPGTRFGMSNSVVQLYEQPWIDATDGKHSITSQLMITQANLLKKVLSGSPGAGGFLQKMLDIMSEYKITPGMKFSAPGATGTLQFADPYITGAEGILGNYTKKSVLDFEVQVSKDWVNNNAKMIKQQITSMGSSEMDSVMKYLKNYGGWISGNKNHVGAAHPYWKQVANKVVGKLGEKDMTVDGLFKATQETNLNSIKGGQIRKLWSDAFSKELIPAPGVAIRFPTTGGESMPPVMAWARSTIKGDMMRISSVIGKLLGGDSDGDGAFLAITPKGMKEFSQAAFTRRGVYSKASTMALEPVTRGDVTKYATYDPKLHASVLKPLKIAKEIIKKNIRNEFAFMKSSPGEWEKVMEKMATFPKSWPPKITPLVNRAIALMGDQKWRPTEAHDFLGKITPMIEWGLKVKGKTMTLSDEVSNALYNLSEPKNVRFMDDTAKLDVKVGEFWNAELPGKSSAAFVRKHLGPNAKVRTREWMVAAEMDQPDYWSRGNRVTQSFISGNSTIGKAIIHNITNPGATAASEHVKPFLLDGLNFQTQGSDITMLQCMKKDFVNKLGQTAWKNAGNLSRIGGMVALGYAALNLFRPNQMGSLGHMPGNGGEKWDYAFTKPELDWAQLMQTPLGNPSDLPKAYIELFNNKSFENIQKKKYLSLPRMPVFKNEIRQKAYTRNNFSTTSYNIDSVSVREKLQKYGK